MAGEQDVGKAGDQIKLDGTKRSAESTAEDAVIAGSQKHDHQQRHQEMEKAGQNFQSWTTKAIPDKLDGETDQQYQARLEQLAQDTNPFVLTDGEEVLYDAGSSLQQALKNLEQPKEGMIQIGGHYYSPDQLIAINPDAVSQNFSDAHTPIESGEVLRPALEAGLDISGKLIEGALNGFRQETEVERHTRIMKEHSAAGATLSSFFQRPGLKDAISAAPSFAESVRDLNECKWSDSIRIWRGHPTEITDYSAEYNLIELDSKDGARRQTEVFAHEAYHATHQDLNKLYGSAKPVLEDQYVDIKMQQEAGAFLQELKVNEELKVSRPDLGYAPVSYMWIDNQHPKGPVHKQVMNDLLVRRDGQIDQKASLEKIETFLRAHPAAQKDNANGYQVDTSGNYIVKDYVQHYRSGHSDYATHHARNRREMIGKGYI